MNRSLYIIAFTALASLLLGCRHRDTSATASQPMPVDVDTPVIDSLTIYKTYPGYTAANSSATVVARVNGQLLSRNYKSGTRVNKGDILFTIESTQYRDAVRQQEAALDNARSEYDYSSRQYMAMKKALESDAVSQMEVLQAKSAMEQAQAAIQNAEAALSLARTNLGYCTVRAPLSGKITTSTVDPGAYVNGEGAPFELATIYDDSKLVVIFSIEDSQYEAIMAARDQMPDSIYSRVPLSFQAPMSHNYTGDLFYTDPAIDRSTGTITFKMTVDNSYDELKPGMYTIVHVPADTDPHALLVNDASIATDQRGRYLYVVNDSDKVVYTPIETGELYHDSLRIVTSGLARADRYVTTALMKVRDGMKVTPVDSKH